MKISVIVPTRLAKNPVSTLGNLWLDRALGRVQMMEGVTGMEVVVGLDKGDFAKVPSRFLEPILRPDGRAVASLMFVESSVAGQAAAVNAAVAASTGDVLAFLEDDDYWEADKLEVQLPYIKDFDLVTCNQRLIDEDGNFVGYNAFAVTSGWLMRRELWDRVGPMQNEFLHCDTEWLGRCNRIGRQAVVLPWPNEAPTVKPIRRVHLVHDSAVEPQLDFIARRSEINFSGHREPLVVRTMNTQGGMHWIATNAAAKVRSGTEHESFLQSFGEFPW